MRKHLCFLVAVSGNIAFAAGNIAIALERYMSIDYDLLIYTHGLDGQDKNTLNGLPHCRVVEFSFEQGFVDYMMNELPENCRFRDVNKLMRFCHFEAFRLLDEYENVVWIDADMSIQADLADILQYAPFGMTLDTPWKTGDQFIEPIEGFDMEKDAYCSGIMMLNATIPYKQIYEWLYQKTKECAPFMKNGDQAIINLMIQEFKLEPRAMPLETYQCICWKKEAIDAKVVHFGTVRKVWNDNVILSCFPEWYRTHKCWLECGGRSDLDRGLIEPINAYHRYRKLNDDLKKSAAKYEKILAEKEEVEHERDKIYKELEQTQKEAEYQKTRMQEIAETKNHRIYVLEEELRRCESEYEEIKTSESYRLGLVITYVPRMILRCLKSNI